MTSRITGFFHGGIAVSDMERSLAFYRDLLGMEIHFDITVDAVEYVRTLLASEFIVARWENARCAAAT